MLAQTTDVVGDMLTALGLLTGKPEVEAAGAALSAVSGMIDAANDPSVQATVQSALQTVDFSGASGSGDQWNALATQLNDFQSPFANVSQAQPVDSLAHVAYDDASFVTQAPDLIDLPADQQQHHIHHGDALNSHSHIFSGPFTA